MKDQTYKDAYTSATAIESSLSAALGEGQKIPTSAEIEGQISAIDQSLSDLNITESESNFQLNNGMSEINSNSVVLQNTINDLQTTLSEVQSQEDAAINSANLTGILTMSNVSSILGAQNFSMPAGYVTDGKNEIMVSVGNKITDINEMKDLVILDLGIDGVSPVKLSDIADVVYNRLGDALGFSEAECPDWKNEYLYKMKEKDFRQP